MTPFDRAKAAFLREVAAVHHRKASGIHVAPDGDDYTGFAEYQTGDLFAFEATWPIVPPPREGAREVTVRGYASPSGDVVLEAKKNLGFLLQAANFLEETRSLSPKTLTERLLWLLLVELGQPTSRAGLQPPNHLLLEQGGPFVIPPDAEQRHIVPPYVERRADGSGSLWFFYQNLDSVGVNGSISLHRAEVRCTKDYQVTLHRTSLVAMSGF